MFPAAAAAKKSIFRQPVQRVMVTIAAGATSGTAAIPTAIADLTRALAVPRGFRYTEASATIDEALPRTELTDASTVTCYRNTSDANDAVTIPVEIYCFRAWAVKSVQRGTIAFSAADTVLTASINAVGSKAHAVHLGGITNNTVLNHDRFFTNIHLKDSTTVEAERRTASGTVTMGYAVIDWSDAAVESVENVRTSATYGFAPVTYTLSASVDMSRTLALFNGNHGIGNSFSSCFYCRLTAADTLTFVRGGFFSYTPNFCVAIVQFRPRVIKSLQRGLPTAMGNGTSSRVTTITSVNLEKTMLGWGGFISDISSGFMSDIYPLLYLSSATQVTMERGGTASGTVTAPYEVIEFY